MAEQGVPFATLDIGSNTVKLAVFTCDREAGPRQRHHESDTVRIGHGVSTNGRIADDRADRLLACMQRFEATSRKLGAVSFHAIATEAFRRAANGQAVLERLRAMTSWDIRVISGDDEARLTLEGARPFLRQGDHSVIADVGGASTEVVVTDPFGEMVTAGSVPVGSGSLFDDVVNSSPPAPGTLDMATDRAMALLRQSTFLPHHCDVLLLPGGTGNLLAQLLRFIEPELTFDDTAIRELRRWLEEKPGEITAGVLGIQLERAHVLPVSLSIVTALEMLLEPSRIQAIPTGVGHGIAQMVCSGSWPPTG